MDILGFLSDVVRLGGTPLSRIHLMAGFAALQIWKAAGGKIRASSYTIGTTTNHQECFRNTIGILQDSYRALEEP